MGEAIWPNYFNWLILTILSLPEARFWAPSYPPHPSWQGRRRTRLPLLRIEDGKWKLSLPCCNWTGWRWGWGYWLSDCKLKYGQDQHPISYGKSESFFFCFYFCFWCLQKRWSEIILPGDHVKYALLTCIPCLCCREEPSRSIVAIGILELPHLEQFIFGEMFALCILGH